MTDKRTFFFGAADGGKASLQQSVEDDLEGFEQLQNAVGVTTFPDFASIQASIRPGLTDYRLFRVTIEQVDA